MSACSRAYDPRAAFPFERDYNRTLASFLVQEDTGVENIPLLSDFTGSPLEIEALRVSPDGSQTALLASIGGSRSVLYKGRIDGSFEVLADGDFHDLHFGAGGKALYLTRLLQGRPHELLRLTPETKAIQKVIAAPSGGHSLIITPAADGRHLLVLFDSFGQPGYGQLFDTATSRWTGPQFPAPAYRPAPLVRVSGSDIFALTWQNMYGTIVRGKIGDTLDAFKVIFSGDETTVLQDIEPVEGGLLIVAREDTRPILLRLQHAPPSHRRILLPASHGAIRRRHRPPGSGCTGVFIFSAPLVPPLPVGSNCPQTGTRAPPAELRGMELETLVAPVTSPDLGPTRTLITTIAPPSHDGRLPPTILLRVYGSYGTSLLPEYREADLLLLESGIGVALAHVAGGGEISLRERLAGIRDGKRTSIAQLVACAEWLRARGVRRIVLEGRSAGALLAATAFLKRPDLFAGLTLESPFLDPITILAADDGVNTAREREEWGDPRKLEDRAWLTALSPFSSVPTYALPPVLITSGDKDAITPSGTVRSWENTIRTSSPETLVFSRYFEKGTHGSMGSKRADLEARAFKFEFVRWIDSMGS